jgi:hypothetical protein
MIATTMCMTTPHPPPVPKMLVAAEARIGRTPPGAGRVGTAGVWWPRSRDVARELPALVSALDLRYGLIEKITLTSPLWAGGTGRMAVAGRTVDVAWQPLAHHSTEICVVSNGAGRWDLLVVPPEHEITESAPMTGATSDVVERRCAERRAPTGVEQSGAAAERRTREAVWEYEGGANGRHVGP